MSSHDTKNPNGGVSMGHVIEPPDPNSSIIRLRLDKLCETPGALVCLWRGPASRGVVGEKPPRLPDLPHFIIPEHSAECLCVGSANILVYA